MTRQLRLRRLIARWIRAEAGTTVVELAVALPMFLLILFVLIDFGRMAFEYTMAEKAMQRAVRLAVVRPPACAGVPEINAIGTVPQNTTPPKYGTNCSAAGYVCAAPAEVTCQGDVTNATAAEIWTAIQPLLPIHAVISDLKYTYTYNPDFGFLGGPYTPMVTVQIANASDPLDFRFVSPLGALLQLAGGTSATFATTLTFPSMAVSLPAEDLNNGTAG